MGHCVNRGLGLAFLFSGIVNLFDFVQEGTRRVFWVFIISCSTLVYLRLLRSSISGVVSDVFILVSRSRGLAGRVLTVLKYQNLQISLVLYII
jgi:hypothetical protein